MNKYALIGLKLGHSYSKIIHEEIFKLNEIEASYDLIEIEEDKLDKFFNQFKNGSYQGINVTIPYKEKVLKYLDFMSDDVKAIGACNTIKNIDGKLYGYNTDYYGFIKQLEKQNIDVKDKNVYILGSGGASKALRFALEKLEAKVTIVSRTKGFNYDDLRKVNHIDLLVNTTPVGMYPREDESPVDMDIVDKTDDVVDIIFNPWQTKLLKMKNQNNNGIYMLIYQAIKAEEIWQDRDINFDVDEFLWGYFK